MQLHLFDAVVNGTLLGLFMAISVGPTLFAIIRYSLNHSYRAGIAFVLGVSVSDILYVALANFAASWLETLKGVQKPIAFGGAVVLIIVGITGFLRKYKPRRPSAIPLAISRSRYLQIWMSGFLINTFNPGVIVIWLAAATATINAGGMYRFTLFGTCLGLILAFDFIKVFLADVIRRRLTLRRIMYIQKFSSICILLIGIGLMLTTIFGPLE